MKNTLKAATVLAALTTGADLNEANADSGHRARLQAEMNGEQVTEPRGVIRRNVNNIMNGMKWIGQQNAAGWKEIIQRAATIDMKRDRNANLPNIQKDDPQPRNPQRRFRQKK